MNSRLVLPLFALFVLFFAATRLPSTSAYHVDRHNVKEFFAHNDVEFGRAKAAARAARREQKQQLKDLKPQLSGEEKDRGPPSHAAVVRDRRSQLPVFMLIWSGALALPNGVRKPSSELKAARRAFVQDEVKAHGGRVFRPLRRGVSAALPEELVTRLTADSRVTVVGDQYVKKVATGDRKDDLCSPLPWHLDRLDQRRLPLDHTLAEAAVPAGAKPVSIFVFDTGVDAPHAEFCAGGLGPGCKSRVDPACSQNFAADRPGTACHMNDVPPYYDADGHGSHVAGTAAGWRTGVARQARVCSIRVLEQDGSGWVSNVIAGINYVQSLIEADADSSGHGSFHTVGVLSLGGDKSDYQNEELTDMITPRSDYPGAVVAVAAGNEAADACNASPASTSAAITVGATDSSDTIASFSNWGSCVDIFAPGVSIESVHSNQDRRSQTATYDISGTSMAAPLVAGAAARLWLLNPSFSATRLRDELLATATRDVVQGNLQSSPNRLVFLNTDPNAGASPPTSAPPNDKCSGAISMSGTLPATVYGTTQYTSDTGVSSPSGVTASGHDVWFKFAPAVTGSHSVMTCGSAFDTVLSVHKGSCSSLSLVLANDDGPAGTCTLATRSHGTFTATAGATYYIRVAGFADANKGTYKGDFSLTVSRSSYRQSCPAPKADVNPIKACAADCANAVPLSKSTGEVLTDSTIGAALTPFTQVGAGSCFPVATKANNDYWVKFTTDAAGTLKTLSSCDSLFDTVLTLHSQCPSGDGDFTISCNDNSDTCGSGSSASAINGVALEAGRTYYARVSGAVESDGTRARGTFTLHVDYSGGFKSSGTSDPCVGVVCRNGGSCSAGKCTCVNGWTGTACEFKEGCSLATQTDYRGQVSRTQSGKTCQAWASQSPQAHSYTPVNFPNAHLEENYCRNPQGSGSKAWCYTTDAGTRWEYCDIKCPESTDPCDSVSCGEHGSCAAGKCECSPGFSGTRCETNINECEFVNCHNGGTCVDGINSYSCRCAAGWDGTHCETRVVAQCQNGGSANTAGGCTCPHGFTGDLCQYSETCKQADGSDYRGTHSTTKSGRTCQRWDAQTPHAHGYEADAPDANYCRNWDAGWTTTWCYTTDPDTRWEECSVKCPSDTNSNPCDSITCQNDGTCEAGVCKCKPGFAGQLCQFTEDCSAADQRDYRGDVSRTRGGIVCQAWATQSPHVPSYTPATHPNAGLDGNACRNPGGSGTRAWCYTSDASTRWDYCDVQCPMVTNPCDSVQCQNGGSCAAGKCECVSGYTGSNCETPPNPCATVECQNGGTCVVENNAAKCNCINEFTGDRCQTAPPKDPCEGVSCSNHGTCRDGKCTCSDGWTGLKCELAPSQCGNGRCDDGENCLTCPRDCNGVQKGKPSSRYCCGDGVRQAKEKDTMCDGNY